MFVTRKPFLVLWSERRERTVLMQTACGRGT
jgi:hypothetical protein